MTLRVFCLLQTSPAYPSQWEGMLWDGRKIYIRYRNHHLKVLVYTLNYAEHEILLEKQFGEPHLPGGGEMDFEQLKEWTKDVLAFGDLQPGYVDE